jgi:arylsulfatase A-like enzyme/cytochrome c-type biogenesis protein CcmH/NrfG
VLAALLCAASACSPPAGARRSIVLVTIDTLRADHVTAAIAPSLARLAAGAVVFDTAISVGPLTLPGHASLLTGQFPPVHGVRDNHVSSLDPGTPTYTAQLKARGYDTAAFVSAVVLHRRYGLAAQFDEYDDAIAGESPERGAADTLARAERWLASRADADRRPFFLWIHLFEPHAPYLTGSYAGEVTAVDRELGRFFEALRLRGLWDDIVLSVTSDHGESLGEHGEDTHGFFIYDSTIRIPWILKAPGLTPGRFAPQVRIVDVMPSMVALAETGAAETTGSRPIEGRDLSSSLRSMTDPELSAYVETLLPKHQFNWSELSGLRTPAAKYIHAPIPELYRLRDDPGETRNLAAVEPELTSRMQRIVAAAATHAAGSRRARTNTADTEKLMSLGYLGGAHAASAATGLQRADPKSKLEIYQLVMSSLTLSESGRAEAALAALARAERLEPGLTQVHYLKGVILGGQERYREAAAALERAIALDPQHVLARFKLALAYLRVGDNPRAETVLNAVIADEPDNMRAYQNLAALAYARGDLARAEAMSRRAIEIDPGYYDAWNTLGAVYLVLKRPDDAMQALERALAIRPASAQAHHNLSLAHQARGDAHAATAASRAACQLDRAFCSR